MAMNPRVARIAKRFNPRMLSFARSVPPFVVIEHVGRVSGRTFETPLVAFAVRDPDSLGVLVALPLPWGPETDWARNVRRAGNFGLTREHQAYTVTDPHVIDAAEAERLGVSHLLVRTLRLDHLMLGTLQPGPR